MGKILELTGVPQRQKNDGQVIREAQKIFLKLATGKITCVCLWEGRRLNRSFNKGELVIFKFLQKTDGLYDLRFTFATSILLESDFKQIPQALEFRQSISSQESEVDFVSIEEAENEINLPKINGKFVIETIRKDKPLHYLKCDKGIHGDECGKKTELIGGVWTCGEHISQNPIPTLKLKAIARDEGGNYPTVSFIGKKAEELLGNSAEKILLWDIQKKRDLVSKELEEKVEGKLLNLRIRPNPKSTKYREWNAYEVLPLTIEVDFLLE